MDEVSVTESILRAALFTEVLLHLTWRPKTPTSPGFIETAKIGRHRMKSECELNQECNRHMEALHIENSDDEKQIKIKY